MQDIDFMINLIPACTNQFERYFSHFIPENKFGNHYSNENEIECIKIENVWTQHDKDKVYQIVMGYYKCKRESEKRYNKHDFEAFFEQIGYKNEFLNWKKSYYVILD